MDPINNKRETENMNDLEITLAQEETSFDVFARSGQRGQ